MSVFTFGLGAGGSSAVTFITGQPSADIALALSADLLTQLAANAIADVLGADIESVATSLVYDQLSSEEC